MLAKTEWKNIMSTACKLHAYTDDGIIRNVFISALPLEIYQLVIDDVYGQLDEGEDNGDECEGTE